MSSPATDRRPSREPGDLPVPLPPGRSWRITALNGYTVTGYLPGWADEDPSRSDVRLDELSPELMSISHRTWFDDGLRVPVTFGTGPARPWDILSTNITCTPGSTASTSLPVANIQLINDHWITKLDPSDLADLSTRGLALLNSLDHAVRSTPDAGKTTLPGIRLPVTSDDQPARERDVLAATIEFIIPSGTEPPVPLVSIGIINDCWITGLHLGGLARFTTKARAFFTMLDQALQPTLTGYRTDWNTTHNT